MCVYNLVYTHSLYCFFVFFYYKTEDRLRNTPSYFHKNRVFKQLVSPSVRRVFLTQIHFLGFYYADFLFNLYVLMEKNQTDTDDFLFINLQCIA